MALRQIRIEGDAAYVPLTKGYEAVIDAKDVPLIDGVSWRSAVAYHPDNSIRTVYAFRSISVGKSRKTVKMHRIIMEAQPDIQVDHIDGNGLNNRRNNMRLATHKQNVRNQRLSRANTSGAKGVSPRCGGTKWEASIKVDGRLRYLGRYSVKEDAVRAVCVAREKFHGEFGREK